MYANFDLMGKHPGLRHMLTFHIALNGHVLPTIVASTLSQFKQT